MTGSHIRIEGFDVFDTVLTRIISPPQAAFVHLGRRLTEKYDPEFSPEFFAAQRRLAEVRCMQNLGHSTSIYDIYDELASTLLLSDELRSKILIDEVDYEKEITYVVPEVRSLLAEARQKGRKVVFISDMYLAEPLLRDLLTHHNVLAEQDSVYVSCDHGVSKSSGKLYSYVLDKEGIKPSQLLFRGNNPHADVFSARRSRIVAVHHAVANPNRFEQALERHSGRTGGLAALFAGASRKARLTVSADSPHRECLREVAAGVAAPMLVSFVIWVLRKAEQLGLTRLYFLSRDGQILLEIANRMKDKLSVNIECRYLYASRLSWNRCTDTDETQEWLWHDVEKSTTLKDMLTRLSVSFADVCEELAAHGFNAGCLDVPLTDRKLKDLRDCLSSDQFRLKSAEIRAENRSILDAYLHQEGVFDSACKGIVDIGWIGTLHETLSGFLEKENAPPVHGFFYGLKKYDTKWKDLRHGFHFDLNRRLGPQNPLAFNGLLVVSEVFCAADHGTVYGFEKTGDGICPQLGEGWTDHAEAWGFSLYRETMMAFADALNVGKWDSERVAVMRDPIDEVMRLFWSSPSLTEAQAWGSFPWDAGQGSENAIIQLAEPVAFPQLTSLLLLRTTTIQKHNISWFEGSMRISPYYIQSVFRGVYFWNRTMQKLYRIAKRVTIKIRASRISR